MPFKFKLAARAVLLWSRKPQNSHALCQQQLWLSREQVATANWVLEAVASFVELSPLLDIIWDPKVKGQFRKLWKDPAKGEVLQASKERNQTCGFLGKRVPGIHLPLHSVYTVPTPFFFFPPSLKKQNKRTHLACRPPNSQAWPGENRIMKLKVTNLKSP